MNKPEEYLSQLHNPVIEKRKVAYGIGTFLTVTLCLLLAVSLSYAYNPMDWIRKMSRPKRRRVTTRQTMVAAVRGIEDPSQIDLGARNFKAVDNMDKRNYSKERIARFMSEGKLSLGKEEQK